MKPCFRSSRKVLDEARRQQQETERWKRQNERDRAAARERARERESEREKQAKEQAEREWAEEQQLADEREERRRKRAAGEPDGRMTLQEIDETVARLVRQGQTRSSAASEEVRVLRNATESLRPA